LESCSRFGWSFFAPAAGNAPRLSSPKTLVETLRPLEDRRSWVLSLYYFLTFGGFVAMAIYLPIFLTEMFHLTPQRAGSEPQDLLFWPR